MERWLIEVGEMELGRLSQEQLELGTLVRGETGKAYLVFRDSFVALKVAHGLGLRRNAGRCLPLSDAEGRVPIATLANGSVLIAEASN
jgi:hypothetical protein